MRKPYIQFSGLKTENIFYQHLMEKFKNFKYIQFAQGVKMAGKFASRLVIATRSVY